jgi:hypothetical protein
MQLRHGLKGYGFVWSLVAAKAKSKEKKNFGHIQ